MFNCCSKNPQNNSDNREYIKDTVPYSFSSEIVYLSPSPKELIEIIDNTGIVYNENLLHKTSSASSYSEPQSINLNLGVYIADLAYCGLFKQYNDANQILESIVYLSRFVFISPSLKTELLSFASSIQNSFDSLETISSSFYYKIVNDLESSQQHKTVALISSGAYIESLYLTLNSLSSIKNFKDMDQQLGNQQFAFKNLISYIHYIDPEGDLEETVLKLEEIMKIFKEMKVAVEPIKSSVDSSGAISISGGKSYYMDEKSFIEMNSLVNKIRGGIISQYTN